MRVALEVSSARPGGQTGIGRVIKRLSTALADLDELQAAYVSRFNRWRRARQRWAPDGARLHPYLGPWRPGIGRPDCLHVFDGAVPRWRGVPTLTTIYDLVAVMPATAHLCPPAYAAKCQRVYPQRIARCDRLIAISETTKRDLVEHLQVAPERIDVTPLGIDAAFLAADPQQADAAADAALLAGFGIRPGAVCYLGAVTTRKNCPRLVAAFAASPACAERQLVLAGPLGDESAETRAAIEEHGLGERVVLPGFLPDHALMPLYRSCGAFAFATHYEGFGLPLLEAMACGAPVVAGSRGAAPEVCDGHAALADPHAVDAIAAALDSALAMDAPARAAARAHACTFTWQRCARATAASYRRAIEEAA